MISSIGRLYTHIIKTRIVKNVEVGKEQCGFTAGRSCTDNTFTLKQLISKRLIKNKERHMIFIELEKAYDTVPRSKLFEVISKSNIHYKHVEKIKQIYDEPQSAVKIGSHLSETFSTSKGSKGTVSLQLCLKSLFKKC